MSVLCFFRNVISTTYVYVIYIIPRNDLYEQIQMSNQPPHMVKEAGLILEPPPRYRYSMGQEQSQPEAEKQAHRFSFYRPSHIRSHSMVESTSTMQQNSQHRPQVSIPPVYSPTDLVLNRGSGETSRPISPPALVDNTPPVPPVNPARQQRRPAMNPPVTGTGHRRHESAGEIMTHHTFGYRDPPTANRPTPLVLRGTNNGGNRTNGNADPSLPTPNTAIPRNTAEDPLMQLLRYDTVFIIDDSASMEGVLWQEARSALMEVAAMAAKYDSDGIDIHFLNSPEVGIGVSAADVNHLFSKVRPAGNTPTGDKLDELLTQYHRRLRRAKEEADAGHPEAWQQLKPVNFLVITDGAPTDDPESVIVAEARRLDDGDFVLSQVGIQFIQIGDDPAATEALRSLDDELAGQYRIRDIVDTTPYNGTALDGPTLTKILLGGINRREDRRNNTRGTGNA